MVYNDDIYNCLIVIQRISASEMTFIVSGGMPNSTHSLTHSRLNVYSCGPALGLRIVVGWSLRMCYLRKKSCVRQNDQSAN